MGEGLRAWLASYEAWAYITPSISWPYTWQQLAICYNLFSRTVGGAIMAYRLKLPSGLVVEVDSSSELKEAVAGFEPATLPHS